MGLELAKAFVRVTADSSQLSSGLGRARAITEQELDAIAKSVTGILATVSAAGAAFTSLGVSSAAWAEQNQVAFATMLGSAEAATKLLSELDTFAATTPFQLPGIVKAGKVLLAFGIEAENLLPLMKNLGDVSAGTGKDFAELATIFGQVRAAGRLTGERMNQFVEAGIPLIRVLAEQFGVAESEIKGLGSAGKISFADVEKAFQSMAGEGGQFFDLMTSQSGTLTGMSSTMKDNFDLLARTIGEPVASALKPVLATATAIMQTLSSMAGVFPEIASGAVLGTTAVSGLTAALILATIAAKALGLSLKQAIRGALIATGVGIIFVVIGAAIGAAIGAVIAFGKWLKTLEPVQKALETATNKFRLAWEIVKSTVIRVVNIIIKAVSSIIEKFVPVMDMPKTLGELFGALVDVVAEFALDAAEWFQTLVENWDLVMELIKTSMAAAWLFMRDVATNFFTNLPQIALAAWDAILVGFNALIGSMGRGLERMLNLFGTVGEAIGKAINAGLRGQDPTKMIASAMLQARSIVASQLKDIPALEAGKAAGESLRESLGGLDLLAPGEETKQAVSKAAELFGKLAFEKAQLELGRELGANGAAGEGDGADAGDEAIVEAAKKLELGRQEFPAFSRSLQDALLKPDDTQEAILTEEKKQTEFMKSIDQNMMKSIQPQPALLGGPS